MSIYKMRSMTPHRECEIENTEYDGLATAAIYILGRESTPHHGSHE